MREGQGKERNNDLTGKTFIPKKGKCERMGLMAKTKR